MRFMKYDHTPNQAEGSAGSSIRNVLETGLVAWGSARTGMFLGHQQGWWDSAVLGRIVT